MRRVVVVAVVLGALAAVPADADTGISGQVDSIMSLTLRRTAPDRVTATVSATVAPTRLSDGATVLGTYAEPVGQARATARGTGALTITYELAGP